MRNGPPIQVLDGKNNGADTAQTSRFYMNYKLKFGVHKSKTYWDKIIHSPAAMLATLWWLDKIGTLPSDRIRRSVVPSRGACDNMWCEMIYSEMNTERVNNCRYITVRNRYIALTRKTAQTTWCWFGDLAGGSRVANCICKAFVFQ